MNAVGVELSVGVGGGPKGVWAQNKLQFIPRTVSGTALRLDSHINI